jgi:FSR family fosmidomycin resistance protein-like MFS transporter
LKTTYNHNKWSRVIKPSRQPFYPGKKQYPLPELRGLKKVLNQWGGATAAIFNYAHFTNDMCLTLIIPLLPMVKASLGLSYTQSGLLITALNVTSGVSQLPMGWLGDRINRGTLIAIGLLGVSLTTLAVGLSPAYYPMLLVLIVMGIFSGAYHPISNTILAGYLEPERRGKVIGLHVLGGAMGCAFSPLLGGVIADSLGWRFSFIILCITVLLAAILVFWKVRLSEHRHNGLGLSQTSINNGTQVKAKPGLASLGKILRPIAVICVLAVITQFVSVGAENFIPLYLVDKHSIVAAHAAMWMGVMRGGGMAGSIFGGWFSDKWGRENALYFAIIGIGPVLCLITILPFNAVFVVMLVLFGAFSFMRYPTFQTLLIDFTPPQLRATMLGLYFFLMMEGMSLAQPIVGYFTDIWGINQVFRVIGLITVGLSVVTLFWAIKNRSSTNTLSTGSD